MELLCVYIYRYISLTILSKEVEKLNFRQYGQMKSRAGQRQREEKVQKRKSQKKEDADARKGRKVAIHCVFPMICGSGGSKSRLAKAAGAETYGEMRHEKLHAVVARSTFPSQNAQNTRGSDHFWRFRCRKSARRCGAKHIPKSKCVQNTPGSDHFWKLRCRKSAHRCGAKHMSKSKCRKHTKCGPLLALKMSKKCTPLWREAHFQVKMLKTLGVRTTFGGSEVEFRKSARRCGTKHISKSKCAKHQGFEPLLEAQRSSFEKVHTAVARSTFRSQNVQTTPCSDHFWRLRCRVSKKCTPLWREADLEVNMLKTLGFRTTFGGSDVASLNSTTLHDTTLCCTTLHYTTLHYTTLHNTTGYNYNYTTTVHYSPLH